MSRPRATILACLALAGGAVFAGCGDDDEGDSASTTATPPAAAAPSGDEVTVGIKDIKFDPQDVTAKVGQKIVWTNNEDVPHNVTATDGADFKSDNLNKDDTFDFTPTKAGKIAYVCTIHTGQNGSITVTK